VRRSSDADYALLIAIALAERRRRSRQRAVSKNAMRHVVRHGDARRHASMPR
jgi:hypothetical protein